MQEANLDCPKCGASFRDPDENCPKCHAVLVQESDIESLKRSKEEWSQVLAGDSPHIPSLPAWISGKSELVERRQGVADYFATLSGHLKAIESEEAAIAEVRGSLAELEQLRQLLDDELRDRTEKVDVHKAFAAQKEAKARELEVIAAAVIAAIDVSRAQQRPLLRPSDDEIVARALELVVPIPEPPQPPPPPPVFSDEEVATVQKLLSLRDRLWSRSSTVEDRLRALLVLETGAKDLFSVDTIGLGMVCSDDARIRLAACRALGRLADQRAAPYLEEVQLPHSPHLASEARSSLSKLDRRLPETLKDLVEAKQRAEQRANEYRHQLAVTNQGWALEQVKRLVILEKRIANAEPDFPLKFLIMALQEGPWEAHDLEVREPDAPSRVMKAVSGIVRSMFPRNSLSSGSPFADSRYWDAHPRILLNLLSRLFELASTKRQIAQLLDVSSGHLCSNCDAINAHPRTAELGRPRTWGACAVCGSTLAGPCPVCGRLLREGEACAAGLATIGPKWSSDLSKHAKERMRQRHFTAQELQFLVLRGTMVADAGPGMASGSRVLMGSNLRYLVTNENLSPIISVVRNAGDEDFRLGPRDGEGTRLVRPPSRNRQSVANVARATGGSGHPMGLLQVDSIYGTVHSEEYPPFNCRTLVNPVWRIRTEDGPVLDCYPTLLQCTIAQRPHLRGSEDLSVEYSVHELPGVGKFTLLVNWPPEEWRANEFIAYRIPGRAIDIMAREGTTAVPHVNIGYSLCCSSHDALNEARVRLGLSSDPVLFGACSVCETELFTQCAICGRLIGRDGTCHAAFHSPREAHGIRFGADKIWKDFPRLHFTWEEVKNLVAKGGTSPVWAEVKTRETRASALAEEFRLMTPR